MNFWEVVALGSSILSAVGSGLAQLASGQPVSVPGIRTYIGGHHVEIDLNIKPL